MSSATQDTVDRLRAELACERGETHRRLPDGSQGEMWPWAARGWRWLSDRREWYRDLDGVNHMRVSGPSWHVTLGHGGVWHQPGAGALPNIEAAEAWRAKQEAS